MKSIPKLGYRWRRRGRLFGAVAVGLLVACAPPEESPSEVSVPRGVVVEEVKAGTAPEKAGLRAGDLVLSWQQPHLPASSQGAQGDVESPFDWRWVEIEQAPRGPIELRGVRAGKAMTWTVDPGLWQARVRPGMASAALEPYLRGRERIAGGGLDEGMVLWDQVAAMAEEQEEWPLGCWISLRAGQRWAEARAWEKAHAALRSALAEARDPAAQVAVWHAIGDCYERQSDFAKAEASFRSAMEIATAAWGASLHAAASQYRLARVAQYRGQLDLVSEHIEHVLEIQRRLAPKSLDVARSLNLLGVVTDVRGDPGLAAEYFQGALGIQEKLAPESLDLAGTLNNLGLVAKNRGDLELATEYYRRALKLKEKLAPGSLRVATGLNNLGTVAHQRRDLELAVDYYRRALEIQEKLAPNSLDAARSLSNLGLVAQLRGDLKLAADYYRRVLEIREKLAPHSLEVAYSLATLASVAQSRGELELAMDYLRRALEIQEKLAPDSQEVATGLNLLGNAALFRGDPELAMDYLRRALEIQKKLAPVSLQVAAKLHNLGNVALELGDLELAADYHRRALEIQEKLVPGSPDVADSLNSLGNVAMARGDPEAATDFYVRALEIQEKSVPGSGALALSLTNLGNAARARGELDLAQGSLERALEIQRQVAAGTIEEAAILQSLGILFRHASQPRRAIEYFDRSLEVLEAQIGKLGSSHHVKAGFRARYGHYYRNSIELQLELNRPADAFQTLERSQARSLLAMLAERELIFSADIPEALEKERRRLAVQYDRTLQEMADRSFERDGAEMEVLRNELRKLQRERDEIVVKISRTSPRLGALRYPQPVTLEQVRKNLDPGTVMLSYSVGEEQTDLFVVTKDEGLRVRTLAIGEEPLRREIDNFREVISSVNDPRSQFFPRVKEAGQSLYGVLIGPVVGIVDRSDRVLIVPDGPLHLLPFGALIRPTGDYLAAWKPVHSVLSATLYAELRRRRPRSGFGPRRPVLAAFGDPRYPTQLARSDPDEIPELRVRAGVRHGAFDWGPLPYTRQEVEGIARLYPSGQVRSYLGEEATEERAKAIGKTASVVHFAVHGHLDDRFPLNSGLVLTIPEGFSEDRDNGLLQAWEIFESVRLDADLVVLSACQSALGQERGGEGLIGLTRAFQYAGARTVVATLWSVEDQVTAELMVRFYRHLRSGKPKDEALRAAQIELIRGPIEIEKESGKRGPRDASAPYYWAAFQVIGDWR